MDSHRKATRIDLFSLRTPHMRAFHMAWVAFFLCFFAWFGVAPLMPVIRDELGLTKSQVGNAMIASVSCTILARMLIGWLCDRYGPRRTFAWLLILGALPVMGIGLANDYMSFLLFRLGIGVIGASFVITQYHTTSMFAPSVVGTANATVAGWGNLGGGVTQAVMPLLFAGFMSLGFTQAASWRLCMVVAGLLCLLAGVAYWRFTQDTPAGNFETLRRGKKIAPANARAATLLEACRDYRVWALSLCYAACFGLEITIDNVAAMYFVDYFGLGLSGAGVLASLFGGMNIFARALGGIAADFFGKIGGLNARVRWLFLVLFFEGLCLIIFSRMTALVPAIIALMVSGLFVKMANGATFAVVPFVNKKILGSVSGIVGAGGNIGAMLAGFLFKGGMPWSTAILCLGAIVLGISFLALAVRLRPEQEPGANLEEAAVLNMAGETT